MKDKDTILLENAYKKIKEEYDYNYRKYPKIETPLGIGYLIDSDPRGKYHVQFGPYNHDWFDRDEVEFIEGEKYYTGPPQRSGLPDHLSPAEISFLKDFVEGKVDLGSNPELAEKLYEYFADEMPYGVQKARTGDPDIWLADKLRKEIKL